MSEGKQIRIRPGKQSTVVRSLRPLESAGVGRSARSVEPLPAFLNDLVRIGFSRDYATSRKQSAEENVVFNIKSIEDLERALAPRLKVLAKRGMSSSTKE